MMYRGKIYRNGDESDIVFSTDTKSAFLLKFNKEEDISELYKDGWCFTKPLGYIIGIESMLNREVKRIYYEHDDILIVELSNGAKYKEFWEYGKPSFKVLREARA